MNSVPLIYIDTTVFAACCEPTYRSLMLSLIEDCQIGLYLPITSDLVQAEVAEISTEALDIYEQFLTCHPRRPKITELADTLANLYIERKILQDNFYCDALHLAIATLAEADVFVTLDHPHFLNLTQGRDFIRVNIELGLKPIRLLCPKHITSHEYECC